MNDADTHSVDIANTRVSYNYYITYVYRYFVIDISII